MNQTLPGITSCNACVIFVCKNGQCMATIAPAMRRAAGTKIAARASHCIRLHSSVRSAMGLANMAFIQEPRYAPGQARPGSVSLLLYHPDVRLGQDPRYAVSCSEACRSPDRVRSSRRGSRAANLRRKLGCAPIVTTSRARPPRRTNTCATSSRFLLRKMTAVINIRFLYVVTAIRSQHSAPIPAFHCPFRNAHC